MIPSFVGLHCPLFHALLSALGMVRGACTCALLVFGVLEAELLFAAAMFAISNLTPLAIYLLASAESLCTCKCSQMDDFHHQ